MFDLQIVGEYLVLGLWWNGSASSQFQAIRDHVPYLYFPLAIILSASTARLRLVY